MLTKYRDVLIAAGMVAFIVAFITVLSLIPHQAKADSNAELQTHIATSSTIVVGPQSVTTVFAAKTASGVSGVACGPRVIGTVGTPIQVSFLSTIPPTGTVGFPQAASTTMAYTSTTYGCGAVYAYAAASTTITKAEFAY